MPGRVARSHNPSSGTEKIVVPRLNLDPVQSLRPWPTVVRLKGGEYIIPAASATDWLAMLMAEDLDLDEVLLGLVPVEEADAAEQLVYSSITGPEDFTELALDVIALVSGRSWWVTLRLIATAMGSWDVLGAEMTLRGVDPDRLSLAAWLDVLLLVIIRSMENKDITMFLLKLEAPPPQVKESAEEMTMTRDAFTSMM